MENDNLVSFASDHTVYFFGTKDMILYILTWCFLNVITSASVFRLKEFNMIQRRHAPDLKKKGSIDGQIAYLWIHA